MDLRPGAPAREVALVTLTALQRQGAWSDGYLKNAIRRAGLGSRDSALAARLCYGVVQNRMLLDYHLGSFARLPLGRLEVPVLEALRLGAYQLLFLTRIPPSAAVNESVELARRYGRNPKAPGVVNGILRALARQKDALTEPEDLATRYSHPQWLVNAFARQLPDGGELEALLAADNAPETPTVAQVNTCRAGVEETAAALRERGVEVSKHPWLDGCLLLRGTGDLEHLEPFQRGWFYIQDAAARLAVVCAGAQRGMRVLDACAAPGGKSFAAAVAMGDGGEIVACDIHPHKLALIRAGAARLGLGSIHAQLQDGKTRRAEWCGCFDLVLADVPCSGLGIIRKKPDIRYKDPQALKELPRVQRAILENVSAYVRPGGVLLYSTCTLLEQENKSVVDAFLAENRDFAWDRLPLPAGVGPGEGGSLTLWPHRDGTDGFFIARLRRRQ